ncbi:hypothetical protein GBAR_LOCUS10434 [Geodia barretti]|uniref:Uncharacterized protein n=1 Tax=Geodia barretti TaxID=519541 RepID=A0AA35RSW1_GEOBA|nr:hypothetical protein GBAR_LOCUS10434 [Geodia barretti]
MDSSSWAPIFSYGSGSSISFATVTPSQVTNGAPKDFWMTTFLPRGPRVTFTALASVSAPRLSATLASSSKIICFAGIEFLLY